MCGIIGFTGQAPALPVLLSGLQTLEYRGYDSAGVTLSCADGFFTVRQPGRIAILEERLSTLDVPSAFCGIGHTRWATHGEPTERNAHPHTTERLSMVHNGIIENFHELEKILLSEGYTFASETDTERAAAWLDREFAQDGDARAALFRTSAAIRGSFAFACVFKAQPQKIYAMRRDSPLIVGRNGKDFYFASDMTALLGHCKKMIRLPENTVAVADGELGDLRFYALDGTEVTLPEETGNWSAQQAQRGGYKHFMCKEIFEEPDAVRKTLSPRLENGLPHFGVSLLDDSEKVRSIDRIHMVACGTAMHAGLIGKYAIEKAAKIPTDVEIASEFRYREPILSPNDVVVLLSQSGETSDTLAALRYAKAHGVKTLAVVNVVGSSVAREADEVLYTWAGPEIAVASTKAYTVQCALLELIAAQLAYAKGMRTAEETREECRRLEEVVPAAIAQTLTMSESIRKTASLLTAKEHLFYIGRGADWALACEASLKLKEISYLHSEAYAAGELKHGTISLVTDGTPVIALVVAGNTAEKTVSGIREVKTRGAWTLTVTLPEILERHSIKSDRTILLPSTDEDTARLTCATALQLLAYHVSDLKGLDVDKPRNLAKSVTVE